MPSITPICDLDHGPSIAPMAKVTLLFHDKEFI